MAIKRYSRKAQGELLLSRHFRVREFASSDGADEVLIDERLVTLRQRSRNWAGTAVRITSGYRSPSHNAAVGGAKSSYHVKGQAADIVVTGKTPAEVARFAQAIGAGGVGLYTASRFTHVDTRLTAYYWKNSGSGNVTVSGHGGRCPYAEPTGNLRRGSRGNGVRWVQWWLRLWGADVAVDGSFGPATDSAVRAFQKRTGLAVDGIAGANTRNALKGDF